ncbi:hypothetical protein BJ508DRAFT_309810 [Ascobolus immersus RN42]|uniref:Uncharacterized protein n=1 Tax=Ascobolus immersus RN42 TaxID=1160509 RepID=A0A3N4I163_ASCIM|nr:hypothetical protein BJ508DRAFT_309810 [Ascobolus immersus RN42]
MTSFFSLPIELHYTIASFLIPEYPVPLSAPKHDSKTQSDVGKYQLTNDPTLFPVPPLEDPYMLEINKHRQILPQNTFIATLSLIQALNSISSSSSESCYYRYTLIQSVYISTSAVLLKKVISTYMIYAQRQTQLHKIRECNYLWKVALHGYISIVFTSFRIKAETSAQPKFWRTFLKAWDDDVRFPVPLVKADGFCECYSRHLRGHSSGRNQIACKVIFQLIDDIETFAVANEITLVRAERLERATRFRKLRVDGETGPVQKRVVEGLWLATESPYENKDRGYYGWGTSFVRGRPYVWVMDRGQVVGSYAGRRWMWADDKGNVWRGAGRLRRRLGELAARYGFEEVVMGWGLEFSGDEKVDKEKLGKMFDCRVKIGPDSFREGRERMVEKTLTLWRAE